jgi:hypothetical protein
LEEINRIKEKIMSLTEPKKLDVEMNTEAGKRILFTVWGRKLM